MFENARPFSWTAKIASFNRLSRSDRFLLLEASVVLMLIRVSVGLFGVRRVHSRLRRWAGRSVPVAAAVAGDHAARVSEIARIVEMASRLPAMSSTCLHRSLTLWWLLRRYGFESTLQVGVRKRDGRFEGHAWVQYDGEVLADAQARDEDYVALAGLSLNHDA